VWRLRHALTILVKPLANQDVDKSDGGVRDVDRDLPRTRDWVWNLAYLEDAGAAKACNNCCSRPRASWPLNAAEFVT
jgi:hypothetical protein